MLETISNWHIWLYAGIFLMIVEVFAPGFIVGCLSIGCLVTSPFAYFGASNTVQLLIFSGSSLICFFTVRPLVIKYLYNKGEKLKTNADSMVGRQGKVTETIDPATGSGYVALDGDVWKARSEENTTIQAGQLVEIVTLDSIVLIVKPLNYTK